LFRCPSSTAAGCRLAGPLALALGLLPASSRAAAILDVSGSVAATAPRLEVRVTLTNRGDRRAGPVDVRGELLGERRETRLAGGLQPGAEGVVMLEFASAPPRPGLHALTLLLEHPLDGPPDAAGNPPMASQRAWLLLALGASPGEAVRIEASTLSLEVRGSMAVRLASRDGEAQRVRLSALTARGLRPEGAPIDVAVPPRGTATALVPIVRAGAPRGSRQALLLVAETLDGPLARTSVAAATVEVLPDAALLPRLRIPLLAGGLALLVLALGYELRMRWGALGAPA
jgi:hypothetical protein